MSKQSELDVNKLEQIIADHNKEMRADMASEITGGTRSKAVTDMITVKAILDWHNKQALELLYRLFDQRILARDRDSHELSDPMVPISAIEAERNKLEAEL